MRFSEHQHRSLSAGVCLVGQPLQSEDLKSTAVRRRGCTSTCLGSASAQNMSQIAVPLRPCSVGLIAFHLTRPSLNGEVLAAGSLDVDETDHGTVSVVVSCCKVKHVLDTATNSQARLGNAPLLAARHEFGFFRALANALVGDGVYGLPTPQPCLHATWNVQWAVRQARDCRPWLSGPHLGPAWAASTLPLLEGALQSLIQKALFDTAHCSLSHIQRIGYPYHRPA